METVRRVIIDPNDPTLIANMAMSQSDPTKVWQIVTNPDWSNIWWPLDWYVTANYDTSTSTYYIWGIKSDWAWIIEKIVWGAITFCKWDSDYNTNRNNRASLTYVLYSEL